MGIQASKIQTPSDLVSALEPETILGKPLQDINKLYRFGGLLGESKDRKTYECTEISTGNKYACKSIPKTALKSDEDRECVKNEVQILNHLLGERNIVQIKGSYEDMKSVHIVMESIKECLRYKSDSYLSEKQAAPMISWILKAVQSCHSKGVIHRNIDLHHFLLSRAEGEDVIVAKAIGFRYSVYIREGTFCEDIVGEGTNSPEALLGCYGKENYVWSVGVIAYLLLSGKTPFENAIQIKRGQVDLDCEPWPSISLGAKDLIRKMLTPNPKKRISAAQALEHPWL
ncbi:unnamed protein product [Microthlaspi erraticum]|uniref:Protein kinase domain-containing protein n=1 Tax=Microthlaspi erraticum TaxID=1685480 RepID=A0A6D2J2T9_9BRAS|nr:unnamed protein product [Microthlaspi erraticum]